MTQVFETYGMAVASPVPIPARSSRRAPDVQIQMRKAAPQAEADAADLVLIRRLGPPGGLALYQTSEGFLYRSFGLYDFWISPTEIAVVPAPDADPDWLPVLLAGNALNLTLVLRDRWPLHASAIAWDGVAVAFVGGSGAGKSTIAALCCLEGGQLLTDDLLVWRTDTDRILVEPGATELRIRGESLLRGLDPIESARLTVDRRRAWTPEPVGKQTELTMIVVPSFGANTASPPPQRVAPSRAVQLLAAFPRLFHFPSPALRRLEFEAIAQLARRVPVFEAKLPSDIGELRAWIRDLRVRHSRLQRHTG